MILDGFNFKKQFQLPAGYVCLGSKQEANCSTGTAASVLSGMLI
jgi:hypothetical protein